MGRIAYALVYALAWAYQRLTGRALWDDES